MSNGLVIGTLHHSWHPFARTREAVAALGYRFLIADSSLGDAPLTEAHETWIRNPCERYYPLLLLKQLLRAASGLNSRLLIIEADILLDSQVVSRIAEMSYDCYFLYDETDPAHPEAYERKRTMSMLLQPTTVQHLDLVLSEVSDHALQSLIHCEPSFMKALLGLQPCTAIRLVHQTHSSREVALLGITQKTQAAAAEDAERSAQRFQMVELAKHLRPRMDELRLANALNALRSIERVVVFGATATTLRLCRQIANEPRIVAVLDDERSKYSTKFCGKPLVSVSRFIQDAGFSGVHAVIVTAEPDEEHTFLSRCGQFIRMGWPVRSIRRLDGFCGTSAEASEILRTEALRHNNGYFVRLTAILMAKHGAEIAEIANLIAYPEATIDRWVRLYDKYGTAALNYWMID